MCFFLQFLSPEAGEAFLQVRRMRTSRCLRACGTFTHPIRYGPGEPPRFGIPVPVPTCEKSTFCYKRFLSNLSTRWDGLISFGPRSVPDLCCIERRGAHAVEGGAVPGAMPATEGTSSLQEGAAPVPAPHTPLKYRAGPTTGKLVCAGPGNV